MPLSLTNIPPDFGVGGSGLTPQGSGRPTLAQLLDEHKIALDVVGVAPIAYHDATILFSDLGTGVSDSILITAFPTNVILLSAVAQAGPQFTGEPDLTFAVGFEGGDVDALIEATALHETGVDVPISVVKGVGVGGSFYADASAAGLAALFTATELDDVTAGSLTLRFFYLPAFP